LTGDFGVSVHFLWLVVMACPAHVSTQYALQTH
jgi:hypothetical protein